jgi:hypothetical protein
MRTNLTALAPGAIAADLHFFVLALKPHLVAG